MFNMRCFLIILFFFTIPSAFAEESITMTTYYPAPNGDYTALKSDVVTIRGDDADKASLVVQVGKVGIGITPTISSDKFEVIGNMRADGVIKAEGALPDKGHVDAVAFYYASDKRLKEHITPIKDGLEKVLALRGVSFNLKNNPNQKRIGLIAQEVETVIPDVVMTGKDGYKSVEYGNLVAVLIEAVKAQQKEIDVLKKQVKNLEAARK
ncbi:MAG: tail fiber domain-containing protein [Candidatus Omnitrophica bacterium]|nr:tail fiber domain-containing protein [Candidatus Omnitrophota bacterium]